MSTQGAREKKRLLKGADCMGISALMKTEEEKRQAGSFYRLCIITQGLASS